MKNAELNGFEVYMASADGKEREEVMVIESLDHQILPFKRDISLWNDIKALYCTIKYISKINPDIVHTHTPKAGLMGMLAAKLCRVPIRIHTVAGMPLQGLTGAKKTVVTLTEKLTYWAANQVWPNSKSLLQFIKENKFTGEKKLKIVGAGSSNGIDLNDYNPMALQSSILKEVSESLNYDTQNYYLLFVGRIVSQKGINELISVFVKLLKEYTNLRLILVGPYENDRDPISDEARTLIDTVPEILSVGYSKKVKYFMSLADLLVFPSHREGFPNVPMQAGAMQCPVICSKVTGNVDIVKHMETGLLHKPKDADDLEKNIRFALNNKQKMKIMTKNHFEFIENKFSRTYVQSQLLLNYVNLLNEKGIKNGFSLEAQTEK